MSKLRKKRFIEKPYNSFIYLRHELLTKFKMEEAVVLEFLKHHIEYEDNSFPYSKILITKLSGISRPTVKKILFKLLREGKLYEQNKRLYFSEGFLEYMEDLSMLENNGTYTKIIFPLMKELRLKPQQYCLLDTFKRNAERAKNGYASSYFDYYCRKYSLEERTYYNHRKKLEKAQLIETYEDKILITDRAKKKFFHFEEQLEGPEERDWTKNKLSSFENTL